MTTVVLTRPVAQSEKLVSRLEELGYDVLISPVLEIAPVSSKINLQGVNALAVTSQNAASVFKKNKKLASLPVFAVGPKTASALKEAGVKTVHVALGTVESLAKLILSRVPEGLILHLCGADVRGDLTGFLSNHDIEAKKVVVYEARGLSSLTEKCSEGLRSGSVDAVMHFSPRSAGLFAKAVQKENLEGALSGVKAICISAATAKAIDMLDWQKIVVARQPSETSMIKALETAFYSDAG